jgi:cytidylate kinase
MGEARIQKALAEAGVASRRAAEALVAAGRVTVNGQVAAVGQPVDLSRDILTVDGRPVEGRPAPIHLALDKPAGVTSTVHDRHARQTVLELVPPDLRSAAGRLYPVGRLDRDSEGLLLLTNDGTWADRVLHPRYGVEREYAIGLARPLTTAEARTLTAGIELSEGRAELLALRAATGPEVRALGRTVAPPLGQLHWYRATLRQGWRRQLRRMFAALGVPVQRLVRVRIGTLRLDDLRPGEVRRLSSREAARLTGVRREPAARRGSDPGTRRAGLVVSLDGPASSGKSSVGAAAAQALGYRFCDTGLLYRALTWLALDRGVDVEDAGSLTDLVPAVSLAQDRAGRLTRVRVDGRDVTHLVHRPRVDRSVSQVARHPAVRSALRPVQRAIAAEGPIVMAGRDIGSVVLPGADLKLYLDASVEERARRRAQERGVEPGTPAFAALERELRERDERDRARSVVPPDAVVIRTDGNAFDQTVAEVVRAIRTAAADPAER